MGVDPFVVDLSEVVVEWREFLAVHEVLGVDESVHVDEFDGEAGEGEGGEEEAEGLEGSSGVGWVVANGPEADEEVVDEDRVEDCEPEGAHSGGCPQIEEDNDKLDQVDDLERRVRSQNRGRKRESENTSRFHLQS